MLWSGTCLRAVAREPWNKSDVLAVALEIFQYRGVLLNVIEATGLLVAADARHNIWMVQTGKRSKTTDELLSILEEVQACHDELRAAWKRFLDYNVAACIEQHNAKSVEERTATGALKALHQTMGEANVELERGLHRIRDRLDRLMT
jgi:hypothetical protein